MYPGEMQQGLFRAYQPYGAGGHDQNILGGLTETTIEMIRFAHHGEFNWLWNPMIPIVRRKRC